MKATGLTSMVPRSIFVPLMGAQNEPKLFITRFVKTLDQPGKRILSQSRYFKF